MTSTSPNSVDGKLWCIKCKEHTDQPDPLKQNNSLFMKTNRNILMKVQCSKCHSMKSTYIGAKVIRQFPEIKEYFDKMDTKQSITGRVLDQKIREITDDKDPEGGIFPLLFPIIGAIAAGLTAAGTVAGAVAGPILAKQKQEQEDQRRQEEIEEQKRHNDAIEKMIKDPRTGSALALSLLLI